MCRIACMLALATALFSGGAALASDQTGGYMIVDKVVLSPSDSPTTIQVWGSFSLAAGRKGDSYTLPQRGYMYWKTPKGMENVARAEWKDLQKAAGTSQVIGFGARYHRDGNGTIRKSNEAPATPDTYPIDSGLVKCNADTDYAPIRNLLALPAPRTPAEGDLVPPGEITLVVRNIADKKHAGAKYAFELKGAGGAKEEGTVEAGDKETRWTPKLKLMAGEKYTWRVWAVEGTWKGPAATCGFVVKGER